MIVNQASRALKGAGLQVRATTMENTDCVDPVIEFYKKDVDRTLLRENLKLTVQQRFEKFERFMEYVYGLREAGRAPRPTD